MRALTAAWRRLRPTIAREDWMRTMALWLFAPCTYEQRPEFVELVVQNAQLNPYPQSFTGFVRQGDAVLSHDTLERLPQIRCPTLISVAEHDILVPPRFSHELARGLVGAEFKTLADAGHGYMWERSDAFNAMCLDFIARHASA
jgi:pimeloyl-ACP methyl ester carboxylesterase